MYLLSPGKEATPEVEMSIPGLDWGMDEVMGKDTKKVPQKKVPYAKPIPAQFQQVNTCHWAVLETVCKSTKCLQHNMNTSCAEVLMMSVL